MPLSILLRETVHMYSQFIVVGWSQTVHMYSQFVVVGWPQTVHVSLVLHAVASCALLAQPGVNNTKLHSFHS